MAPSSPIKQRRIIATAGLPYANGLIHLGHLVEYLQVDFWTRFQKMRGHDCAYICGDDTHGTPIMIRARAEGRTPEALIAQSYKEHTQDFKDFQIEFDNFSSTHSDENRKLAEEIYLKNKAQGHFTVKAINQLYCDHDKMFLPDRLVKGTCPRCGAIDQYGDSCDKCGATYAPTELKGAYCSICRNPPGMKQSDHILFKLNNFKDYLKEWVPQHTTKEIANKMNEWLTEELRDWDISRDEPYFGFKIPETENKYFYVWVDAPIGYISSTWQWCKKNGKNLADYWQSDDCEIYHFIGKDIVYFHSLFWPAMLKNSGYRAPNQIFVHGMLMVNGEKLSKSKGNFVSARTYLNHADPTYLRYYYASKLSSGLDDLDLSLDDFVSRVNSELVGKITNLGSRGAQMLNKKFESRIGPMGADGEALVERIRKINTEVAEHYEHRDFAKAIGLIRQGADEANKYFDEKAPWKTVDSHPTETQQVLSTILHVFRLLAIYLKPVIPVYSDKVASLFNEPSYGWNDLEKSLQGAKINTYQHLATRIEAQQVQAIMEETKLLAEKEKKIMEKSSAPEKSEKETSFIKFDDFAKVDLRVAKIIEAEEIAEADKLLRLKIDLGGETRQIIAGIKSAYKAQDLVGRLTVVVANLEPRKMKFGVSEGMVLAAGEGGKDLFILSPDSGAKPGDKVK